MLINMSDLLALKYYIFYQLYMSTSFALVHTFCVHPVYMSTSFMLVNQFYLLTLLFYTCQPVQHMPSSLNLRSLSFFQWFLKHPAGYPRNHIDGHILHSAFQPLKPPSLHSQDASNGQGHFTSACTVPLIHCLTILTNSLTLFQLLWFGCLTPTHVV